MAGRATRGCPQDHSLPWWHTNRLKNWTHYHSTLQWLKNNQVLDQQNTTQRRDRWVKKSSSEAGSQIKTGKFIWNGTGRGAGVWRSGRQNKRLGELRREHNRQSWQAWVKMSRCTVHTPPLIKESGNRWAEKVKWWMRWERGRSSAAGVTTGELVKAEPTGMNELA